MTALVRLAAPAEIEARLPALAGVLHACVAAGASVNFVTPFSMSDAERFWREVAWPPLRDGRRLLWTAEAPGRVIGTVQLALDTPPNQTHRAEVTKLLVHPAFRRAGLGRALMQALLAEAQRRGRWLITLDTVAGDAAESLYASLGFEHAGVIPDYARSTLAPQRWEATTFMYKRLTAPA